MAGYGSIDNPMKLADALKEVLIRPGHTVNLRGVRFKGDFVCTLKGTKDQPITIRPYENEHPIIDGGLVDNGAYTIWKDIEFCYTGWEKRKTDIPYSFPEDMPYKPVAFNSPGVVVERCVFHDIAGSVELWMSSGPAIFRYNVAYHGGWSGPDRGHGHHLYAQNNDPTQPKQVYGNIFYSGFCLGLKAYSASPNNVNGFDIHDNISCASGILYDIPDEADSWNYYIGSWYETCENITLSRNYSYQPIDAPRGAVNRVGYVTLYQNKNIRMADNYWPEGAILHNCELTEVKNNFYGPRPKEGQKIVTIPTGTGRANIAVYNWDMKDGVTVDLGGALKPGERYRLRNVSDYYGDIIDGSVSLDGTIHIDMRAEVRKISAPVLWDKPKTTYPEFGAFTIEAVN